MTKKNNTKHLKENGKKLIVWEGFKKELPWILFWALLMVMAYGYYQDKKICEEILSNPCEACYELNQTLIDSDYLSDIFYDTSIEDNYDIFLNGSLIPLEDKNPNDRTISSFE